MSDLNNAASYVLSFIEEKTREDGSIIMINSILSQRFDALDGCSGHWILDLRDHENRGYDLHYLPGYAPGFRVSNVSPLEALAYCVKNRWKDCRLLFSPEHLNADCMWPGGYDAPSHHRSNNRVFREEYKKELEFADGDADGLSLDIRFLTDDMIETIKSLEDYPILDECDWSNLEIDDQNEAWDSWASSDWRRAVESKLGELLPENTDTDADEILDSVENLDSKLLELFHACMEQSNAYWLEQYQGGWYVDVDRVASVVDTADLRDLTDLALPLAP